MTGVTPEDALMVGKLLSSQYPSVAVCHDNTNSSHMIEQALIAGIMSTGGNAYLVGHCPASAMPFMSPRCDCYVNIAAKEPNRMCGISIHNPDGSFFDEIKIFELKKREVRLFYPEYNALGEVHRVEGVIDNYQVALGNFCKKCDCQVVLGSAHRLSAEITGRILASRGSETVAVRRVGHASSHSITDYGLRDLTTAMASFDWAIGLAVSHDGSRFTAFDENGQLISPAMVGAILVKMLSPSKVIAPVDCPLMIEDQLSRGVVIRTKRNIRSIVDHMGNNSSNLGMDMDGRFVFPDFSMAPDGIAGALKLAEIASEVRLRDMVKDLKDYWRTTELIRAPINNPRFLEMLTKEVESLEYNSISNVDGIRLDFDNGWLLFDTSATDNGVTVTSEARDEVYVVALLDIARSAINQAIRESD